MVELMKGSLIFHNSLIDAWDVGNAVPSPLQPYGVSQKSPAPVIVSHSPSVISKKFPDIRLKGVDKMSNQVPKR